MFRLSGRLMLVGVVLILAATACSFGPPPSCGEEIGGTADEALFDQYFSAMALVDQETGLPGQPGEDGVEFAEGNTLVIQVESKADVDVRACVQPRSSGGAIPFDQTETLLQGEGTFDVGSFEPGSYVIRVIVDGTLVQNFPFTVK